MGASCFEPKTQKRKSFNIRTTKSKFFEDNDTPFNENDNKKTRKKLKKSNSSKKITAEYDKEINITKKKFDKKEINIEITKKNKKDKDKKKEKVKESLEEDEKENKENKNNFKEIKEDIEEKKKQIKKSHNPNLMKSYMPPLKVENNYYIVCPTCKFLFPSIKKFSYDSEEKDYIISYTCKCNSSNKLSKSNFLNFINENRPPENNENFNDSKIAKKLLKAAKENKDFPGKDLSCSALKESIQINGAAPPASINKSIKDSNLIKSKFKFKASVLNPIQEEKIEKNNNKKEVIISQAISQISNNQDEDEEEKENSDYIEYICNKTFQKNARIASLIELENGYLATGSYDCKICIWDINKPSGTEYEKELQEIGIVICLLEFKPNYLLAGTNFNYISLWNLNSESEDAEAVFYGHDLWVNCLVKCNEEKFASCSNDKSIIIWNFENKKQIRRIKAHDDCVLALIKLKNGNLCSGGADLLTKIWKWETGEFLYKLEGYYNWIRCICQFNDKT